MGVNNIEPLTVNCTERETIAWLRNVLTTILDISPIPKWLKQPTAHLMLRVPDSLLGSWADATNVQITEAYRAHPNLALEVRTDKVKQIVADYLKTHQVVPKARNLRHLVATVLHLFPTRKLPAQAKVIERETAALALADCTPLSYQFVESASSILEKSGQPECLLSAYHEILKQVDKPKVAGIDRALSGTHYGQWVAMRLKEVKRWLRGGIQPNVRWEIESLPDNGGIYHILLKGGKNDESQNHTTGVN